MVIMQPPVVGVGHLHVGPQVDQRQSLPVVEGITGKLVEPGQCLLVQQGVVLERNDFFF